MAMPTQVCTCSILNKALYSLLDYLVPTYNAPYGTQRNGGVREIRTLDLLLARQTFYQLKYNPKRVRRFDRHRAAAHPRSTTMGCNFLDKVTQSNPNRGSSFI